MPQYDNDDEKRKRDFDNEHRKKMGMPSVEEEEKLFEKIRSGKGTARDARRVHGPGMWGGSIGE